ncbi:hypothetical protein EDB85DRAFT_807911 [Lactarius pseudohatsudake]|nr:hypothetical protein EDB85DRAFT_807911 [Lactarius pseudohatsudake]
MPVFLPLVLGAAATGATAGIFLTPFVAPVVLSMFGFGVAGPVLGTVAAGVQAGIGNVVAGSLFATAQSVAMGGAVPLVVTAIGASVGRRCHCRHQGRHHCCRRQGCHRCCRRQVAAFAVAAHI